MQVIDYLQISLILFLLSLIGIVVLRKNVIMVLISIEMMLLAINLNFMIFSAYLDDIVGQIFALLVLTVAAAESALGLAILVIYYRLRGMISIDFVNSLKG
jgi:NADH-quinone oxidoreductase subunit K